MGKRILLIDDEDLVLRSVEKLMKRSGYEVVVCKNGEEALTKFQETTFDLIISDIRMPGINGVETLKKLRDRSNQQKRKHPKEILITGFAEEGTNEEAELLGVSEYLYKPFDVRDFMSAVNRSLA